MLFDEFVHLGKLFNYLGSKNELAPLYPQPLEGLPIIEPFAGSAGYSCFYGANREVILYDADPTVVNLWNWLITEVTPDYILSLPLTFDIPNIDLRELDLPQPAKDLIGYSFTRGTRPQYKPGPWAKQRYGALSYWGPKLRQRVANAIPYINKWRAICCDYTEIETDLQATWFIDPPYIGNRTEGFYKKKLNHEELAGWTKKLTGRVISCDLVDAKYLPFKPLAPGYKFRSIQTKKTPPVKEAIYTYDNYQIKSGIE